MIQSREAECIVVFYFLNASPNLLRYASFSFIKNLIGDPRLLDISNFAISLVVVVDDDDIFIICIEETFILYSTMMCGVQSHGLSHFFFYGSFKIPYEVFECYSEGYHLKGNENECPLFGSPDSVIERFDQRSHEVDSKGVAEYIRALVITNALADYLPDEQSGRPSRLPMLVR